MTNSSRKTAGPSTGRILQLGDTASESGAAHEVGYMHHGLALISPVFLYDIMTRGVLLFSMAAFEEVSRGRRRWRPMKVDHQAQDVPSCASPLLHLRIYNISTILSHKCPRGGETE